MSALAAGCAVFGTDDVRVRIHNVSTVAYDSASLMGREVGSIPAGQHSEYAAFEVAYRYGYVRVFVDGEKHELIPIDFVGEEPLEGGLYTYRVLFVPQTGAMSLELVVDAP